MGNEERTMGNGQLLSSDEIKSLAVRASGGTNVFNLQDVFRIQTEDEANDQFRLGRLNSLNRLMEISNG